MWKAIFQNPWSLLGKQIQAMSEVPSMHYSPGLNIKWLDESNAFMVIEPLGWRIFVIDGQVYYLIQTNIPFFCGPSAEGYGKIDLETGDIEYNCLPKHKELERIANLQKGNVYFIELDKVREFKKDVLNLDERFLNSWYVVDFINYASFYEIIVLANATATTLEKNNISTDSDNSVALGSSQLPYNRSLKRKFDVYLLNKAKRRRLID